MTLFYFRLSVTCVIDVFVLSLTEAKDEFLNILGGSVAAHAAKKGSSYYFADRLLAQLL